MSWGGIGTFSATITAPFFFLESFSLIAFGIVLMGRGAVSWASSNYFFCFFVSLAGSFVFMVIWFCFERADPKPPEIFCTPSEDVLCTAGLGDNASAERARLLGLGVTPGAFLRSIEIGLYSSGLRNLALLSYLLRLPDLGDSEPTDPAPRAPMSWAYELSISEPVILLRADGYI